MVNNSNNPICFIVRFFYMVANDLVAKLRSEN